MMNLMDHLPALQVLLPLCAAPLCVLFRARQVAYALALLASLAAFVVALGLAIGVASADSGVLSYAMGSWPPPLGIEYRVDALTAFMVLLVSGIGLVVVPYSRGSLAHEVAPEQHYLLYAMLLLCLGGLLGMVMTGDAFNLFVFMEISS
ncbi:MAG TPA: hypothetical protein PLQ67_04205, partial [Burkholderiaceae bacterium]|nr:hypothetical protein [Burkholderiaceae bacterium]